ncbi:hypothetical protein L228DRAFT_154452 [Xylona heveae TC161]|uniref:WAC domain-containing protein n=1 Tax=Xylona heveae (strain CBS 132557 / TC161) TaxID=1328760 RepID=A0A165FX79_XYLHT|nr:hypothetical protein L228DRAFT_154452 [Xylona heveae TC161]KZF21493.1 hypothetical protein L228DRAFT_154452 [Xylona heveae TC161]
MVLFKRKPVQYLSRPQIKDDNADVWVIGQTGEIFTNYGDYLHRMDFYKQKRFICTITGHSGLTFFEALKSEMEGSKDVDKSFPEALKEPILRRVQFSTVSRIDSLVDKIYDDFKQDFYPGENVTVILDSGERLNGVVREKAKFPELTRPDGMIERKAFSRYFVKLLNRPHEEALVDDEHIVRDRKAFTKHMLRSFIKKTVVREAWTGAPWLVKERFAKDYRIDTNIPAHLLQNIKGAEKKAGPSSSGRKSEQEAALLNFLAAAAKLPELKPAPSGSKGKLTLEQIARNKHEQFLEYRKALNGHPSFSPGGQPSTTATSPSQPSNFAPPEQMLVKSSPKPAPPPPIKYPIEDLEIIPLRDGTHRPALKYLSHDTPSTGKKFHGAHKDIHMRSVGPLLETWDTINVFCEIFPIDSFTFDDYIEALRFHSDEVQCELFVELHCALLKECVDEEGNVLVNIPEVEEDSEDEESDNESSATPTPEPEEEPPRRRTRSSYAKAAVIEEEVKRSPSVEKIAHRAEEMLGNYGWIERLQARDFRNGGWEIIIVGLLHQLSLDERRQKLCEELLSNLAPLDEDASQETARLQYAYLDINLRIQIIQILCLLIVETKSVRGYMEECSEAMTMFRKDRVNWQRTRKEAAEELRVLDEVRQQLIPESTPPAVEAHTEEKEDVKMTDADDEELAEEDQQHQSDEGDSQAVRSLRRADDRAAQRKRKREEEKEKKEKAEAAAKLPKLSAQAKKLLKDIEKKKDKIKECEKALGTIEMDLREADCFRTKILGRDRFWNRYYWLERNGMPYGGLPESSTSDAGYANGCIWVQGPDTVEREGFIDLPEEDSKQYRKTFQMTVAERKRLEEGHTNVFQADQWGYYDEPDSLDMLIGWLDPRGHRELKLRKELQALRDKMTECMKKRKEYLAAAEEQMAGAEEPTARVSTRTKTYVDTTGHRCLEWQNSMALEELGHLHSEQPRPAKKARRSDGTKEIKATNKQGKPLGRQGARNAS